MKQTFSVMAIALLFTACGPMPDDPGSRAANLDLVDPVKDRPMPRTWGLFPDLDVREGLIASMGLAPDKPVVSAVQAAHRFAAICSNGSMVIAPRVESSTFTLSFELGLISLADQRVLEFGGLSVELINGYLRLRDGDTPVARRKLWLPPTKTHVEVTVHPYRVEFYLDGEQVGARRRDSATFSAVRLRFGGSDEGDVVTGMCGAIDNVRLRDERKAVLNGRTAESTNSLLFGFDFDGNASNAGRGRHSFAFEGAAGLITTT